MVARLNRGTRILRKTLFTVTSLPSHMEDRLRHKSQNANLCVLFIAMTSKGNGLNWLMEVQAVLDFNLYPLFRSLMTIREFTLWRPSIYETVPEMCPFGSQCVGIVEKGATVGVATGPTSFVVLQDAPLRVASHWSWCVRSGQADALIALSKRSISLLISPCMTIQWLRHT
jgi:hypothetical protein